MVKNFFECKYNNILLLGIGGISMSAIANFLIDNNYGVFGYDKRKNNLIDDLINKGINYVNKFDISILMKVDAVIYSSAISLNNKYILSCNKYNIPLFKRSEVLGDIIKKFNKSIAISGSHGKTTTTSMLSNIFIDANFNPTVFLGGESCKFGNYRKGGNDYIILEACEYKKNFLNLKSNVSVILNIDNDHLDSYYNFNDEIYSFNQFVSNSISFVNNDDNNAISASSITSIYFSIKNGGVYQARNIKSNSHKYSYSVFKYGKYLCRINLNIYGYHNIYNSLCAFAVADYFMIDKIIIKKSLENFINVKRRNELLSNKNGVEFIADYAHHPTELSSMINLFNNDNTLFIFQPHTFSRTKGLLVDFANVLSKCKNLIVYKTYSAREKYEYIGSAEHLFKNIKCENKNYIENKNNLKKYLQKFYKNYKKVIVLGAGDIYNIIIDLLNKI